MRFGVHGFHRHAAADRDTQEVSAQCGPRLRYKSLSGSVAAIAAILIAPTASGDPPQTVRCSAARPIAPRGGVLVLPLTADQPGPDWPITLELTLADGRSIEGVVAWIHRRPQRHQRRWTDEPRQLAIRPILATDDTSVRGGGRPVLMARLPADGEGPVNLGTQLLEVIWMDVPDPVSGLVNTDSAPEGLVMTESADRPAPDSPFAYWRWVLLARRLGQSPPAVPDFEQVGRMLAEHESSLWLMGIDRLAGISPGVAGLCLEILTRTCRDQLAPTGRFAAWETDTAQIARLLSILLDFSRGDEEVADRALAWADDRDPLLMWVEAGYGNEVRLTLANPTAGAPVVRFSWLTVDNDIPVAEQADPGSLRRVAVPRPPAPETGGLALPGTDGARMDVLLVEAGARSRQLTFGPSTAEARPPGAFFFTLKPTLRLFEVRSQVQQPPPADRACSVQLRQRDNRWEVFFDCRRPPLPPPPEGEGEGERGIAAGARSGLPGDRLAACRDWKQTAGIEAVTLLIGPEDEEGGPSVALTVPETGWPRLFAGRNDGTMQVHRRSYADRWLCRIVLPDSWLTDPEHIGEPLLIGAMRTHGDCDQVQTAPNAAAPWHAGPTRSAVDLTAWDAPTGR